jgi:hypothetical protein
MTGTFTSQTVTSGSGREPASVHIGLNSDGTYAVSVGLPQIQGTTTGSESSSYSGQCSPKEGKTRTMEPMPTTIQGNSLTSDGSHRVDPENPNQLSGSYSASFANVTETITWNLQRCGAPLRLVELKFEDMKFPNWDDWQELDEQTGTVDGNWVRIKATVFNASGESKTGEVYLKETYKGDKWNSGYPDVPLKDQTFTVTLGPGEQKEVEMLWDSRGYAWFDDGRPRLVQRIKAEVWENFKKVDELTRNLKVRPRPVIIVGGVSTTPGTFEVYQNLLTTTHSYDWKAQEVVDTSAHGTIAGEGTARPTLNNASIYAHADNLTTYVDGIRRSLNAWHVDMIGHSTGGLVARLYVHKQMEVLPDMYPVVKHLMLMGTPNNGMSCTDPIPFGDAFRDQEQLAKAVSPEEMAIFNRHVTQRKGTKFSALVGEIVPVLCGSPQWSDGFVAAESAKHGIEDVTVTTSLHNSLGDTENFANCVRAHIITGPDGTYPFAGQGEAGGK